MNTMSTDKTHDLLIYSEQIRLLYASYVPAAIATVFVAVLFVMLQWNIIAHSILLIWLLLFIVIAIFRILCGIFFHRANPSIDKISRWGRLIFIGNTLAGLMWAASVVLFFPPENLQHQMAVGAVISGIVVSAVTVYSIIRPALFCLIIPSMILLPMQFILEGSDASNIMAAIFIMGFAFIFKSANSIHNNIRDNIHLRIEAAEKEQSLILAKKQAEQANLAKSEFLSRMSHELRTPMNAILGFGHILTMGDNKLDESQSFHVKEILSAGKHLLNLINEILDIAAVETGELEITMEEVDLDTLINECLSLITPLADAQKLEIINNISGNQDRLNADPKRLKQVLVNLLSNAIKYNRPHGRITLESKHIDQHHLCIKITDSGNGLSEAEIDKLFTPFERLGADKNTEGTGIGLIITKHLIESMGGEILIESTPNVGTSVSLTLLLADKESSSQSKKTSPIQLQVVHSG